MPLTTGGLINYNQKFIDTAEHIDVFIKNRNRKHPQVWYDMIARGALTPFDGMTRKTNIFHSGLGEQSGLKNWKPVQTSRKPAGQDPGFDACNYDPQTFSYAVESLQYSGYRCSWQSEPICLNDIRFLEEGKQQAMNIAGTMAYITISVWENWNREQYVWQAVQNGNALIVSDQGIGWIDDSSVRFNYDPFAVDDNGDNYLTYPESVEVKPLAWRIFDWLQDYLGDECPEAALANDGGLPIFGLMLHKRDIERAIESDTEIRESFRYWAAKALLEDYRQVVFDKFKGWLFMHDSRQMRFAGRKRTTVNGVACIQLTRVEPFREGRAVTIGNVPESNPAYHNAEYAIGTVMMKDVVMNLIPNVITDLGSGMKFGPAPGYDGQFRWVNEYDRIQNPANEVGFFWSRYEAFPKPGLFSNRAVAFLYRRNPHILTSEVNLGETAAVGASVALAANAVAGDVDSSNLTLTVRLASKLACATGPVTLTQGGSSPTAGFILDSSAAPTYVIGFSSGTITFGDYTTAHTVTCA